MLASNTSTLVLLAKVECLEDFIEMSPTIEIPSQVKKEILTDSNSYYAKFITKLINDNKIRVSFVSDNRINNIMQEFNLDEGKAATFVMFDSKKHKSILTDDRELMKLCKLNTIPFICAMAVIIILYEKNILSKEKAIEKLKKLNEIGRYSKDLFDYFKKEIK